MPSITAMKTETDRSLTVKRGRLESVKSELDAADNMVQRAAKRQASAQETYDALVRKINGLEQASAALAALGDGPDASPTEDEVGEVPAETADEPEFDAGTVISSEEVTPAPKRVRRGSALSE